MKKSTIGFAEGFLGIQAEQAKKQGKTIKAFDWDKAAEIIKKESISYPNLTAEAGLNGDWAYTGGTIFEDGNPVTDSYTYLASNWAKPTLILSWDGEEQMEVECSCEESERFNSGSKWDEQSLKILGNDAKN